MADLNALIAQGYQPPAPIDPFAQYAKMQQLNVGQNQNALAQYQLAQAQRQDVQANALNAAYASATNPETGEIDYKKITSALASGGAGSQIPAVLKNQLEYKNAQTERDIKSTELLSKKLAMLPEAYLRADTPEAYLALHQSVHADPVIGPYLKSVGATPEKGLATLQNAIQTGTFDDLRLKSMQGVSQILDSMKPLTVAASSSVYNPKTGTFTQAPAAPEKVTPTTLARLQTELAALPPNDPRRPQYMDAIRKETQFAPQANTTINMPPQEKAEQGARGTLLVKEYGDVSAAAKLAAKTLPAIEGNLNILNNGFKTGFGTETIAAGANVLAALGVPNAEKFATNAQTFLGSATQAVLQKQLEQKGPQTESDAQRIQQTGAQLGNTVQANQFMLSTAKAQLKRDMDQRNFYDNWWKQNKTYDGAESAWYSGEGGKSLFDRPELKAYKAPTAASTAEAASRPSLDKIFGGKR
jgi:hypothetical protein